MWFFRKAQPAGKWKFGGYDILHARVHKNGMLSLGNGVDSFPHKQETYRKHKDPVIRNVLVIAMTASAIQGDREKCLEAGMNNYLAKPVRAQTLKALLESYLSQPEKVIPDLQRQAKELAKTVLNDVEHDTSNSDDNKRPSSARSITAQKLTLNDLPVNGLTDAAPDAAS